MRLANIYLDFFPIKVISCRGGPAVSGSSNMYRLSGVVGDNVAWLPRGPWMANWCAPFSKAHSIYHTRPYPVSPRGDGLSLSLGEPRRQPVEGCSNDSLRQSHPRCGTASIPQNHCRSGFLEALQVSWASCRPRGNCGITGRGFYIPPQRGSKTELCSYWLPLNSLYELHLHCSFESFVINMLFIQIPVRLKCITWGEIISFIVAI